MRGEGSWNAAWDGRPARWLHRPDSAWLLFGVCACLAPAIEFLSDVNNIDDVNHQVERIDGGDLNASSEDAKQDSSDSAVGSDYKVTGCLQLLIHKSNSRLCFCFFFIKKILSLGFFVSVFLLVTMLFNFFG